MEEPKTSTSQWDRLSASAKTAFQWAWSSALGGEKKERAASYTDYSSATPAADTLDLLSGIILSHGQDSEPIVLFDHLGLAVEPLFEALEKNGKLTPRSAEKRRPEPLSEFPAMTGEAEQVLQRAFDLDKQFHTSTDPVVELRYLFGGLLLSENPASDLLQSRWQGGPIAVSALLKTYPRYLENGQEFQSYRNFLEVFHPLAISHFDSDTTDSEEDLIGIGQEVNAFAYLMTSTSLKPPLAIGLFGNWGSGKSFFMKSLRRRIDKITEDARSSNQPQKEIDIYKHVVQIEFNAWHYVESDLWASLVDHIFRNLRLHGTEKPDILKERQEELIKQLRAAKMEQDVAVRRRGELEKELNAKEEKLDELVSQRSEKLAKLRELEEKDVLRAMKLSEEDKENYRKILDKLGVTAAGDSAADFLAAFEESKDIWRRGNALVRAQTRGPAQWTIILIAILISVPLISFLLSEFLRHLEVENPFLEAFSALAAFLAVITGYVRSANAWLSKKIKQAEEAQAQLTRRFEEEKAEYDQRIEEARTAYREAEKAIEKIRAEEEDIRKQIREIEQELEIVPIQLLRGFVDERSESQDYRARLGLMALVRRDLKYLSELIEIQNRELMKKDQLNNKQIINRIVLYIDDLDRCPADKVVKVLQAVHLLMAFPLFVVMVAVDSRWLSVSLQSHYKELLSATSREEKPALNHFHQASPHDYLEKIFQIPFWINPLVTEARMRIVRGLMGDSVVDTGESEGRSGRPTGEAGTTGASAATGSGRGRRSLAKDLKTNFKPKSLAIEPEELRFIDDLQLLLGESPRSVKRFVNVYRLIKAIALTFDPDFNRDDAFAPYKLNLFLLCITTGLPALSRQFYRALQHAFSEASANEGETGQLNNLRDVLDFLEHHRQTGLTRDTPFDEEYLRLSSWLTTYKEGAWLELSLEAFRPWARQVARFSYQVEIFQ